MAREFGVTRRTIERLYKRFEQYGEKAISPNYYRCGLKQPHQTNPDVLEEARKIRESHPMWGAPFICIIMSEKYESVPSPRTLQRWFAKQQVSPAPPGIRPRVSLERATRAHETWQMDASELIRLQNGKLISWLRVVDEFTGAVMQTTVFPHAHFNQVPATRVQGELRKAFCRWGMPEKFRVDNGTPWGSWGDFPTDLALWLIGLGLDVVWIPPRQPQKNGVVERSQGVGKQWAEPFACTTLAALQSRLDKTDRIQREVYRSIRGVSRLEAYPELRHSKRHYDVNWEKRHWNISRVVDYLSGYSVCRHLDQKGFASVYNHKYYVAQRRKGEPVEVFLDPTIMHWVFADKDGNQLRTHPAAQITRKRIQALDVTERRKRKPR